MSLTKKIARRRKALQWFAAEEADPASVLFQKPPSKRLAHAMQIEGLVDLAPVGQGFHKYRVTPIGRGLAKPC